MFEGGEVPVGIRIGELERGVVEHRFRFGEERLQRRSWPRAVVAPHNGCRVFAGNEGRLPRGGVRQTGKSECCGGPPEHQFVRGSLGQFSGDVATEFVCKPRKVPDERIMCRLACAQAYAV